jgi:hypothetical protein
VTEAQVREQLERAASYYADYGVKLLRGPTEELGRERLLEGTRASLDEALRTAGIDPGARLVEKHRDAAREVVCRAALGPLREFIAQRARPNRVNLVVLQRIADPGSAIETLLPNLRGLTLDVRSSSEALKGCLGLVEDFPSTVLIGLEGIAARRPETVDVTLAHELGHVLGLKHPEGASSGDDLMSVEPPRCVPGLGSKQIETIRSW